MIRPRFWIAALLAACLAAPAWADPAPADTADQSRTDARALAAKIDQFIAARLTTEHVTAAPPAEDGAYLHGCRWT